MKRKPIAVILLGALSIPLFVFGYIRLFTTSLEIQLSEVAPLSAEVTVRTPTPTSLKLTVHGLDGEDLQRRYSSPVRKRSVQLLGLYPGRENRVSFIVADARGRERRIKRTIETAPLPEIYPEVRLQRPAPELAAPGMTFFHLAAYDEEGSYHPLASAMDKYGRVRWFYREDFGHLLSRLENGNLMIQDEDTIREITMLGWPRGTAMTLPEGVHHDALELPSGDILALTTAPGGYEDGVAEVRRNGTGIVRSWDFRELLDPDRPRQPINLEAEDWLHLNGIDYDEKDDAFLVSGRDQSAVVKVSRERGEVVWILGNHEQWRDPWRQLLLDPVGEPFDWAWGQHAPEIHPEDNGRVLIYDNGNHRSYENPIPPEENFSRAVEYRIDEERGTVRQLWEYGRERGAELFTPFIGDADYLSNGNRLVTFGGVSRKLDGSPQPLFDLEAMEVNDMKISAHVIEVTADRPAQRVLEYVFESADRESYAGYRVYQAERFPLYPRGAGEPVPE